MKKYKKGSESSDKKKSTSNTLVSNDDNNKEDETTKEKVNSTPSTPKKSKPPDSSSETPDSNYSDYHDVFSLTQDKSIDVTWDWNSTPSRKKNNDRTPKRSTLIHKKRTSNSPLLYNPTKRKIIRKDNSNDLDKLKADMIALQATIALETHVSNSADESSAGQSNNVSNDGDGDKDVDIPEEFKFDDDFNDESVLVVSLPDTVAVRDSDVGRNNDIDDMFDDSMNDTMIRCSQEIEERLKITPDSKSNKNSNSNSNNNNMNRLNSFSRSKSSNDFKNLPASNFKPQNPLHAKKSTSKLMSEESLTKFTKHKSDPINKPVNLNGQQSTSGLKSDNSNENTASLDDDNFLDDSFDDFLASCETDLTKTENTDLVLKPTDNRYGKVYSPRGESLMTSKKSHTFLPKVPHKSSSSSCSSVQSSVNRNASVPIMKPTGTIPKNPSMYNNNNNNSNNNNNYNNSSNNNNNYSSNNRTFKRTESSTNLKTSVPINASTPTKPQDWKFFKSKSNSDSSFEHKTNNKFLAQDKKSNSNLRNNFKVNTSVNSKSSCRAFTGASVSTEHLAVRRTTTCLDSSSARKNIVKDNTQLYNNVDRFGGRRNEGSMAKNNDTARQLSSAAVAAASLPSSSRDVSIGMQSLQLCTPEEIERKRIEAKMKLEARKKRLQASNSDLVRPSDR